VRIRAAPKVGDVMMYRCGLNFMGDGGVNRRVCSNTANAIMPAEAWCSTSDRDLYRSKFENFTRFGPRSIRPDRGTLHLHVVTLI
jgi:hypothetical protein